MSDINITAGAEIVEETNMRELKKLQQRLNQESIKHQFKKKVVGGLDEEDVTKYIVDIEGKFKQLEQNYKKVTDDLYVLRNKLNSELEEKYKLEEKIKEARQDNNTYILESKQKDLTIDSLNENYNSENAALKNEVRLLKEEQIELISQLNVLNIKCGQLTEQTLKFENENTVLKTQISELRAENEEKIQLKEKNSLISQQNNELIVQLEDSKLEYDRIKKHAEKVVNDNAVMRTRITDMEIENIQLSEQRKELVKLQNRSNFEIEQLKEYAAKFENDNNTMKEKLSELENENIKNTAIQETNNSILQENIKMKEEIVTFEELLNQSSNELEQLTKDAEKYAAENTLMKENIDELKNTLSAKDYKINEISNVCKDLKQELEIEKSCSEKLNMDLVIFKQKIISLEETINEKLAELEEQRKTKERIEQELAVEKSKVLSYRINGFKEEFSDIYKKLENLEAEAKQSLQSGTFLQQQLALQQKRADKAESDLAAFIKLLSGAKDKFYSERNPFGDQFDELIENGAQKVREGSI